MKLSSLAVFATLLSAATACPVASAQDNNATMHLPDRADLVEEVPALNAAGLPGTLCMTRTDGGGDAGDGWGYFFSLRGFLPGCCDEEEGDGQASTSKANGSEARILFHSGQEVLTESDLLLPGRDPGSTLAILRRHTTRRDVPGSVLGRAWEFSLHQYVDPDPALNGDLVVTGFGRTEPYELTTTSPVQTPNAEIRYEGGMGNFSTAVWRQTGAADPQGLVPGELEIWFRGGTTQVFTASAELATIGGSQIDVTKGLTGMWSKLISPAGNEVTFTMEPNPLDSRSRVKTIVDSFGREISFRYIQSGVHAGYLEGFDEVLNTGAVHLSVDYEYDRGLLIATELPDVDRSITASGVFEGRPKTTYSYVGAAGTAAGVQNALSQVVYPEQVGGSGPTANSPRLAWTYCQDPVAEARCLGFVKTHSVGQHHYSYTYEPTSFLISQTPNPGDSYTGGVNDAVIRTSVEDRNGSLTVLELNRFGHVLSEEVMEAGSPTRPNNVSSWTTQFTYNDDGLVTASTLPNGAVRTVLYPASTEPRRSHGNALVTTTTPGTGGSGTASYTQLATKKVYEPIFNHVYMVVDPRFIASTPSTSLPAGTELDGTTTFIYDWMEDTTATYLALGDKLGMDVNQFAALLTTYGVNSTGDVNGAPDGPCGLMVKVEFPDVDVPTSLNNGDPVFSAQAADEIFRYNSFGQRIYHRDAEGFEHEWAYFGEDDPNGMGLFGVPGGDTSAGGFIKEVSVDTANLNLTTTFAYNGVAGFPQNTHGAPTLITDPRGVRTDLARDLLDRVVIAKLDTVDVTGGTYGAQDIFTRIGYDANGNVVRTETQDFDHNPHATGSATDFVATEWTYDLLGQATSTIVDADGLAIETTMEYDEDQNLERVVRGFGSSNPIEETWTYDARDILISHTSGNNTRTVSTLVDDLGNVTALIDAHDHPDSAPHPDSGSTPGFDNDYIGYEYDGWGRLIRVTNRIGTVTEYTLNELGQPVETVVTGPIDDFLTGTTRLSETHCFYDERGRRWGCATELFYYPDGSGGTYSHAPADPGLVNYPPPSGGTAPSGAWVVSLIELDRLGRPVRAIDSDGDVSTVVYDGAGRIESRTDAAGSTATYTYDGSSNLIATEVTEKSPTLTALSDTFRSSAVYDGLGRVRSASAGSQAGAGATGGNGETTTYDYDSLGNVTRVVDELGNETHFLFDPLSRLTEERRFLSAIVAGGATGASPSSADPTQGGGDGIVTLLRSYDIHHRLVGQTDDGALVTGVSPQPPTLTSTPRQTVYVYDDLDRLTQIDYADGFSESWNYNADSELETHVSKQGVTCVYTVDPRGRTKQMRFEGPFTDPNLDTFPGAIKGLYPAGTSSTKFSRRYSWDGLDRLWGQCDHNGGTIWDDVYIDHPLDSLGRKVSEKQTIDTAPYNLPQFAEVAQMHYSGASRMVSMRFPKNQAETARTLNYTHDALDRVVSISDGSDVVAQYDWVGSGRLARKEYFFEAPISGQTTKGAVLDLRNAGGTSTITSSVGTYDAGYDVNGRPVAWEWNRNDPGGTSSTLITGYRSVYNGVGEVGTGRRVKEYRDHLSTVDSYLHDANYRMVEFVRDESQGGGGGNGILSTVSLDGVDKMTAFNDEGVTRDPFVTAASSQLNQYSSFDDTSGASPSTATRFYDRLGNLIEDESGRYYQYGPDGRLFTVWSGRPSAGGVKLVSYVYDAIGRRIVEDDEVTGDSVQLLYAGSWQVVEEKDLRSNGMPFRQFVVGPRIDEHLQVREYDGQGGHDDYWYHCNAQGSVGAIVDSNEQVVEYYTYSMFGEPTITDAATMQEVASSAIGNRYMFQGRRWDDVTEWYHFRHRQYDPKVGEFATIDPSGMWRHGQGGGYSAFRGDPWSHADPGGLNPAKVVALGVRAAFETAAELSVKKAGGGLKRMSKSYTSEMRKSFNRRDRKRFLESLKDDPDLAEWKEFLEAGTLPDGYVVHHKRPLMWGGDNSFDNLCIIDQTTHELYSKQLHYLNFGVGDMTARYMTAEGLLGHWLGTPGAYVGFCVDFVNPLAYGVAAMSVFDAVYDFFDGPPELPTLSTYRPVPERPASPAVPVFEAEDRNGKWMVSAQGGMYVERKVPEGWVWPDEQ